MRCVKFDRNASTGDFFFSVWMRFLPCLAWRASASACVRPALDVSSAEKTLSGVRRSTATGAV